MRAIRTGWELAKRSLQVVFSDAALGTLVLLGTIAAGLIGLALGIPAVLFEEDEQRPLAIVFGAVGVYLATAAAVFFGVALAAAAAEVLAGRDATVRRSIAVARTRIPQILGWALVLTTVNLVLSLIRERGGAVVSGILGAGWSLATFLAVPVIALEGLGPVAALKRSFALFKERWGEQVVGRAGVGLMFFLLGVLPAAIIIGVGVALDDATGIVIAVVGVLIAAIAMLLSQAAAGVLAVALYRHATGSQEIGPFSADELENAVRKRRGSTAAV